MMKTRLILFPLLLWICLLNGACSKTGNSPGGGPDTVSQPPPAAFDINSITDTYEQFADYAFHSQWGPYNVHDPSIQKYGDYYYCFSTDVGYGTSVPPGIQIRKSKDLIQWQFVGWAFNGLPRQGAEFITGSGGVPNQSLWAPYVVKVGDEYRLYYSLSSPTPRLSVIALATARNPEGPWTEKGLVVVSKNDNTVQTNAIDPTVIITASGAHYMYYGSGWDGIYVLPLDPVTGLAAKGGDKGRRIANRGFTNGAYNGNIEAPEIIYNRELKQYFLFIAYDWLETKYNLRVCRSVSPEGPFLDYKGQDANANIDHGPMILAPYRFNNHGGWQGTAHCSVFQDSNQQFFMAHQARPGVNRYFMDLHVRKIFWTADGWPIVSPERYAGEDNALLPKDAISGNWEQIILGYQVVPGYANEQADAGFQRSLSLSIAADGTLNGDASSAWSYNAPWLEMKWPNGHIDKVLVQKGRDWENKKTTLVFSGLNKEGTAIWGKKVE